MEVLSPLTGKPNIKLIDKIQAITIIDSYKDTLGIDVKSTFEDIENVYIYECLDTGYKFYYPLTLSADGNFYEELQKFDWYYMDWKWEHEIVSNLIQPKMNVLEIGSGNGSFVKNNHDLGIQATGLELNKSSVRICQENGLNIYNQTIQEYSQNYTENHDIVCSFQVMEHISNIHEVIEAALKVLRRNGLLIISVPNNDSFIKNDKISPLNLPPHHMNLWTPKSIANLANVFHVKLTEILYEPLQPYHFMWYQNIIEKKYIKHSLIKLIYKKFKIDYLLTKYVQTLSGTIKGHSMLAIFTK